MLHGLWPQPRNNVYCNVDNELKYADKAKRWRDLPCLALDEEVEEALAKSNAWFCFRTYINMNGSNTVPVTEQM